MTTAAFIRSFRVKLLFFYLLPFPDFIVLLLPYSLALSLSLARASRVYLSLFSYLPRAERHRFLATIKTALRPATRPPHARVPLYKLTSIIIIPSVLPSFRFASHFPRILCDLSGSVYVIFRFLPPVSLFLQTRSHVCTFFWHS